jgi:hypothetical protein
MSNGITELRFPGLTELDVIELENSLEENNLDTSLVRFEEQSLEGDRYGEPATITVIIIVSVAALKVLNTWLLKNRQVKHFKKKIETIDSSGRRKIVTIEIDLSSSTAPEAELVKQLGIDIDPKQFT